MKKNNFYQKDYFESHKKLYFEKDSVFWKRINLIFKHLEPVQNDIILECGCGFGTTALELAKKSKKVIAVDNSSLAVRLAKNFIKKATPPLNNLRILKADLRNLPFADESFDKICFSEVVEHLENSEMVLKEIWRVLKKRGIIFISTWPNVGNIFWSARYKVGLGSREDFNPQSRNSLERLLVSSGFKIKFLEIKDFYIPGLIPLLILIFKRGARLDKIVENLERFLTKGTLGQYFGSTIIAVVQK